MKSSNKKILTVIISVVLCLVVITSYLMPVYAETDITALLNGLTGAESADNGNLSQTVSQWLNGLIQEDEDSAIDTFVDGIKDFWTGNATEEDTEDNEVTDDSENVIVLDKGAADNVATLFNLTVNELKKGAPAFRKTIVATMDSSFAQSLQGGLGPVTGIVESLIGTKDLFAGVIDGTNSSNQITTDYPYGNDIKNNIPVTGKDYVADISGEDIKDYTISANLRSGAYKMHIDFKDVEGSAAKSGLSKVFDVTDKAYATIEVGTNSLNINVMLKYVNNYVECQVNRKGELVSYTTHMGITFMFQQPDGTYSSTMPYFDIDFEEKGIIYYVTTEYSSIDFEVRKIGDADNNGKISAADARIVLRAAAKLEELTEEDVKFCDITQDGKVMSADAREILRASAGLSELPTSEEVFGYKEYQKDPAVQNHINDILAILVAYQSAKDEKAEEELKEYYDNIYGNDDETETETTTVAEETTTKGEINTPANKVEEIIGGISNSGDFGSFGDIMNDNNLGQAEDIGNIIGGLIG